ncbi:MAG: restriction endonuclease subunit S [Verrucomicrobia bacterium]|nr:restriction endonuclease subunit S [Verrucomicrobiota bacterium]
MPTSDPDSHQFYPQILLQSHIAIPQLKRGRLDLSDVRRITGEHFRAWTRKAKPQPNDVVLSRRCNPGETAVVPAGLECALGQNLVLLRADGSKVFPPFFRWLVRGVEWWEQIGKFLNVGAVFDSLKCADIPNFRLLIPPLSEQKAIAAVLGTLDDRIELNRRMNATLAALARALFQSWFVNFDLVRAGGGQFQDSVIGMIPKDWKVERFHKHITADRGLSYKGEGLRDDGTGLPMHNLNSVYEGGGYKHEGIKYYAGEYREKHLLNPGDMIVTNTEQGFDHLLIGHAAIVPERYGPKGLFSHHIYRVRHKPSSPFSPHYLVELFNNPRWHYWISGFSNGTTINMLPMDALEMPLLVVPPDELLKKFTALAAAVHSQVEANLEQSRTLAGLRDALLPKLLSGELRLKDADTPVVSS